MPEEYSARHSILKSGINSLQISFLVEWLLGFQHIVNDDQGFSCYGNERLL